MANTHPSLSLGQLLLPEPNSSTSQLLATRGLELARNARSAIYRIGLELRTDQRDEVLVPAYHCPSGVMPLLAAGMRPVYYRIRTDLSLDLADLQGKLSPRTAAVMVIHFFGQPTPLDDLLPLHQRDIALIEDWSHSFMDSTGLEFTGHNDTYRVYSFWKLLASGTGGGLIRPIGRSGKLQLRRHKIRRCDLVEYKRMLETSITTKGDPLLRRGYHLLEDFRLRLKRRNCTAMRLPAAENGWSEAGEKHYSFNPDEALDEIPVRVRRWIESSDLSAIARARSQNYAVFAHGIKDHPIIRPAFSHAPPTAPWVFPAFVVDRDARDRKWREQGVALHTFGPYLHSGLFRQGGESMIGDARFLASSLLCLSVHQDLSLDQIEMAAQLLSTSR